MTRDEKREEGRKEAGGEASQPIVFPNVHPDCNENVRLHITSFVITDILIVPFRGREKERGRNFVEIFTARKALL